MIRKTVLALAAALTALQAVPARAAETEQQRNARMEWWREARFGMFVHWGLYSGLAGTWEGKSIGGGGVEWLQTRVGVDTETYTKAAKPKFVPKPGFAKAWAKVAKDAGCKYVVFTTKHHEGFYLGDSKLTDFDGKDFTGRDLIKEITDALHEEGLKVGFYHSIIDWHHADYDFKAAKGLPYPKQAAEKATEPRDQQKYIKYLHGQVDELLSNYGKVDVIWWDYSSTQFDGDAAWGAADLIKEVRAKQPGVIMNNRLYRRPEAGFSGMGTHNVTDRMDPQYGDFVTPENNIPANGLGTVDWETCMTMNGTWGFSEHDKAWKSTEKLIRNLIDIASKGGNYLLNVGPTGDGTIPPESVERMEAMGAWLKKNGEAIYGTKANPFKESAFDGRVTKKGGTLYLHVFKRPDNGTIVLPVKAAKAVLLDGGKALEVKVDGDQTTITLPETLADPIATVIKVD
ncbi:alpha-L-fucosidase [Luteolibacter ambystomatis]|uniref:alpha-L-fucosidase n=1 Tax=Luteolibacter ambystomatis TaxID=2824561 RepID=A0A975G8A8_9BACT|nr:alpha-L-fucosidase [Luteolibacter ambystomatis]QUE51199.1 alpha-L-fucosidase [Luteolibacter ambystomatis]